MDNISIFEINSNNNKEKNSQLANRMRPRNLSEFYGQAHIVGDGKLLSRMIKANRLTSIILYGPAGTGKTTLAHIISNELTNISFVSLNATMSNTKEVKEVIDTATKALSFNNKRTLLFIDEIHRFNKSQQDLLLPHIESGLIVLIGATTENPYFEVNNALLSRSTIFRLEPLSTDDIKLALKDALKDKERGLGHYNVEITDEALTFLSDISNGDVRKSLNALELATITTNPVDNVIHIDLEVASECIQQKPFKYDKNGDNHYNTVSAFIKSMRGSDPDAALHYLATMLLSGEDPMFIARRIVICASEDVGNADPTALTLAVSAMEATRLIGMPEARIPLAQAVTYIATAKKSNASYMGINMAMEDAKNIKIHDIPAHLKDSAYAGAKKLGAGVGYLYPHAFEGNYVDQQYLPDELVGRSYYNYDKGDKR